MHHTRPAIPRTVWLLGGVSLLTDMGSEIVHSLLPVLLAGSLGASALTIGLLEGSAEALVLVTKLFSGYLSDAWGRRKPLVLLGYGLAAAVKPLFPLTDSVLTIATARLLDRFGKGIRGAPRDALIGDVAPADIRGACFGLRQSMDTLGAAFGPLAAIGLLWWWQDDIHAVLWFALIPAFAAVALLVVVPEPTDRTRKPARLPITRQGLTQLGPAFWQVCLLGMLVALARFSEAFLVLRAVDLGLTITWVPLVLVVMSVIYAASAWPAGALSDRWPRTRLLALAMATLAVADLILAHASGLGALFLGIALWGLHMGLSQGVFAAWITDVAPSDYRGTAFGVFNLASGLGLLLASGLAGWLWDSHGPAASFSFGAATATLATLAAASVRR